MDYGEYNSTSIRCEVILFNKRQDFSTIPLTKDKVIDNSPESKEDYIEIPLVVKKDSQ